MKCSDQLMDYFEILALFSLCITIFGIYKQIKTINKKSKLLIMAFPLSLFFSLLFKLPVVTCVAFETEEAWWSVIGILIKLISVGILTFLTYKA